MIPVEKLYDLQWSFHVARFFPFDSTLQNPGFGLAANSGRLTTPPA